MRATKEALGWDPDARFVVPDGGLRAHGRLARARRGARRTSGDGALRRLARRRTPTLAAEWDARVARQAARRLGEDALPTFDPAEKPQARDAQRPARRSCRRSRRSCRRWSAARPTSSSRRCTALRRRRGVFARTRAGPQRRLRRPRARDGRGVNGLALHGGIVKPYGSTFLVFTDYMRAADPALGADGACRSSGSSRTTRSALGEDGPTHQPVEHLAALRAIPDLTVIRPADANETAEAWRVALERARRARSRSLLTRQDVPVLDRGELAGADGLRTRRLRARATPDDAATRLDPVATGAEVCARARRRATARRGGRRRRASSRCRAGSSSSPAGRGVPRRGAAARRATRLAVEAGVTLGWERWVGVDGDVVGVDRFGASAPGATVLRGVRLHARERRRARRGAARAAASTGRLRRNHGEDPTPAARRARSERLDRLPLPRPRPRAASSRG